MFLAHSKKPSFGGYDLKVVGGDMMERKVEWRNEMVIGEWADGVRAYEMR